MEAKFCRESRAVQTHRILPFHCNMHQTLYGGQLMEFIDNCASITVSRHTRSLCVTASMDQLNFIRPLHLSDSVCVETIVTGTGRTSVEVFAKVVEGLPHQLAQELRWQFNDGVFGGHTGCSLSGKVCGEHLASRSHGVHVYNCSS